jgi:hypothetical protein
MVEPKEHVSSEVAFLDMTMQNPWMEYMGYRAKEFVKKPLKSLGNALFGGLKIKGNKHTKNILDFQEYAKELIYENRRKYLSNFYFSDEKYNLNPEGNCDIEKDFDESELEDRVLVWARNFKESDFYQKVSKKVEETFWSNYNEVISKKDLFLEKFKKQKPESEKPFKLNTPSIGDALKESSKKKGNSNYFNLNNSI